VSPTPFRPSAREERQGLPPRYSTLDACLSFLPNFDLIQTISELKQGQGICKVDIKAQPGYQKIGWLSKRNIRRRVDNIFAKIKKIMIITEKIQKKGMNAKCEQQLEELMEEMGTSTSKFAEALVKIF
jgi:hypothetical protein